MSIGNFVCLVEHNLTPFILRGKKAISEKMTASKNHVYDKKLQIWIDVDIGLPVISNLQSSKISSRFGETTITENREGADISETALLFASRFGETTMTKSHEGTDSLMTPLLHASRFGETQLTNTMEGADQSEITSTNTFLDAPHFII